MVPPCYRGEHSGCGLPAGCERKGASERRAGAGEEELQGGRIQGEGGLGRATRGATLLAGSGVCQLANFSAFQLFDLLESWEVGGMGRRGHGGV